MGQPVYKYDFITYQMSESFRNMDHWSLKGQRTGRKMNSLQPITTSEKKNLKIPPLLRKPEDPSLFREQLPAD